MRRFLTREVVWGSGWVCFEVLAPGVSELLLTSDNDVQKNSRSVPPEWRKSRRNEEREGIQGQ